MILDFRAATLDDADSVADVYLRSPKELVACAPLVHSDDAVREWIRWHLIPLGRTTVALVDGLVVGLLAVSKGTDCSWIEQLYLLPDERRGFKAIAFGDGSGNEEKCPDILA